jgi:hypothetical protein
MVITSLRGGLGNQLFQVSAGIRLAAVHGTELKLDLSRLEDETLFTPRSYELAPFSIDAEEASAAEVEALAGSQRKRLLAWLPGRARSQANTAANERHFHFDSDVLSLDDDVCLRGYWQSERYFADAATLVRKAFRFKEPAVARNAELAAEIVERSAVSLHVRRGDYVSNPAALAIHGLCTLDYYQRAVASICEQVANASFYVFSDEPDWVRANLHIDAPLTIIDHNGPDACHEDMRLMSLCAHHIIANSSFSWWGAWLGANSEKIVIAPERWFSVGDRDTRDVVPEAWIRA